MMELLYFSDISQLDYVLTNSPDLLKQVRPITSDMVVAFELEKRGIEFIDEWNFLTPDEIKENWDTAYTLSTTWWAEQIASTEYEGFSLADAAQQDVIYPFEACLNARTVYSKIFSKYPVNKIAGYFLPQIAVIRTGPAPTSRAATSVAQAVLFYMAENHGVHVERLDTNLPLSKGRVINKAAQLLRKTKDELPAAENDADKVILVYETTMPIIEHASLMAVLNKLPKVKVISIAQHILEMGAQFNGTQLDVESGLQPFWNSFLENNYQGDYPEIFANKHLQFQFERVKVEMEVAKAYGEVFATFLDVLKPSLVIFGHEAFTIERTLVRLARKRKIPTAALVHGGLGFKSGFRGLIGEADEIMVWNDVDVDWLSDYGAEKSRLNKVGCLRYQAKYSKYLDDYGIETTKEKSVAKANIGVSQSKPMIVLLTAAINTGFAAPQADASLHRQAIREFLALVQARPDIQFVIKAHPSFDYYELYRRLQNSNYTNLAFLEQFTLDEILDASDIGLMINYVTSAALEAMLHRVPLVYLSNAVYPLLDWSDALTEVSLHRVRTKDDLEKRIDSLCTNLVTKLTVLDEADRQIKILLDVKVTSVNDRMLDLIQHLLDSQQSGSLDGFTYAQRMYEFLHSDYKFLTNYFRGVDMKPHCEKSMFVFVYLAGLNNCGHYSIARIFELFHNVPKNGTLATWNTARWELMTAYISGRLGNWGHGHVSLASLRLLLPYFVYPQKYVSAPVSVRKDVIRYILQNVLGQKYSVVMQLIIRVRKMYFGLFR